MQQERIAAFGEYVKDVATGAYPEKSHLAGIDPAELGKFLKQLPPKA